MDNLIGMVLLRCPPWTESADGANKMWEIMMMKHYPPVDTVRLCGTQFDFVEQSSILSYLLPQGVAPFYNSASVCELSAACFFSAVI